jgi:hypothetical protein
MDTLSQAIEQLRKEGYTLDFNIQGNALLCSNGQYRVSHDEFVIDQVFRFEGMTDPADEATLYAISSPNHGIKGILVNGAGIYSDDVTDEMLRALRIERE